MRLNRFLFGFCLLFVSICAWAQEGSINGTLSSEGSPMALVNVGLLNTVYGDVSDENGVFSIQNIPYGSYTLVVSMVGYERISQRLRISAHTPNLSLSFDLVEKINALDDIVVSGTLKEVSKLESPVPVEVYSQKFFRANPTPSIFESLQNVNGVRPQLNCNVCNTGDIHINGLEGPYTMVLIDGMPIVSGLSTVYGLTGIPQSLIERVEIVKGPASTLYGSEAVGGLVNIITKKPGNAPQASVDVFATDWGEVNTDIGLKYNLGKRAQSLLGINYFNYQNPIDNNGDNFTDLTLQDRISIFNKVNFQRKDNRVFSIAGRYVYEDRWGGEMNWNTENRGGTDVYGESIYTSRWETFGIYQFPTSELLNFQFSANGHVQDSFYGDTEYTADQYVAFGQLTWNKTVGKHDIVAGAVYRYTYYDDNTPATFNDNTSDNNPSRTHLPGIFVQDEISLKPNNKLLLGMRYDYNSLHGGIVTPRVNYKWNSPNKRNILRISAGNGYRVANVFTEDHAALSGARTVEFDGELRPETSWNTNINFVKKFYTSNSTYIGLDATAFYTYFTNRILPDYETDPNKIIYSNLEGNSISRGVSVNLDMAWDNGLKINGGLTVMDVTVEENGERTRQILTESVQGVWSISYTFGNGIQVDYTGNLYGPMRLPLLGELDDRPAESPWFSIQNIQLTKKFGSRWEVYGGVKNLLNFTPADNSIARPFDPFDRNVTFGNDGQVIPTPNNPKGLTFDPTYVYASNQGIRGFLGLRFTVQ
ncbi:TonB-dependent receptor [Roseivirga sp. 4D4]|uniref:TonB-dependent receptor n=1 Tax=Roseivirga sp. 4D4 TaxID=1889784 RepID=UPI0009F2A25B|nr:TonB-dependent receptor [Roseivirga sp. 4D4]